MTYKVVKIVNEYLVVVDYGKKDNAVLGDKLEIYKTGVEVNDPSSNENLGTLDITKANIKVIKVYEKMSLCKSNDWYRDPDTPLVSFANTLSYLSNSLSASEIKPLNVKATQISGGYDEEELVIYLKDPVKIVYSKHIDDKKDEISESEEYENELEDLNN